MKKYLFSLFVLAILIFPLSGCGQATTNEFTQTRGGITAVLSMTPDVPAMMEPVLLSLKLTDAKGKSIEGAQVAYDLTMPGMTMPPNQPQASDKGNGLYEEQTTFTMSGDWRAEVTVTYNGETTLFTFDFSVK
jgi:hypothetical protein